MYKALFAFETDQAGEMALAKDELVEIAQKDEAGSFSLSFCLMHRSVTDECWCRMVVG